LYTELFFHRKTAAEKRETLPASISHRRSPLRATSASPETTPIPRMAAGGTKASAIITPAVKTERCVAIMSAPAMLAITVTRIEGMVREVQYDIRTPDDR
jgi:hypothetical protein